MRRPSRSIWDARGPAPAQLPKLPIYTVAVRPVGNRMVCVPDIRGEPMPLPGGVWSQVPVSADVMIAIRDGDLEQRPGEVTPASPELRATPDRPAPVAVSPVPAAPARPVEKGKKGKPAGKHAQTLVDVRAIIDLVDSGSEVIEAARKIASGETQAQSLARKYRRHHRNVRKDMAFTRQVSADTAAYKMSAVRPSAAAQMSAVEKTSGPGRTHKR
jgi:hypothetical protein